MDDVSKNLISLLQYLLPGFLAAWVFYGFTSFPKPSQFERVVQALIFTLIIQLLVHIEKDLVAPIGDLFSVKLWTNLTESAFSALTALVLGATFAYFTNNDKFHRLARNKGITQQTSYPSEWFGAFLQNVTYIVLHLKDERRIYGWPHEWPPDPNKGHIVLEQPAWLDGEQEIPLTGVKAMLISVQDIKWVEFMETRQEPQNEQKTVQSAAAAAPAKRDHQ